MWSWLDLYEPIGITSPPPLDDSTYRAMWIAALRELEAVYAHTIEAEDMDAAVKRQNAEDAISRIHSTLRDAGVE